MLSNFPSGSFVNYFFFAFEVSIPCIASHFARLYDDRLSEHWFALVEASSSKKSSFCTFLLMFQGCSSSRLRPKVKRYKYLFWRSEIIEDGGIFDIFQRGWWHLLLQTRVSFILLLILQLLKEDIIYSTRSV